MIIGRDEELKELERSERSRKSELVCVYGRRYVGKTHLATEVFGNQFAFRVTGVEGAATRTQLRSFGMSLWASGDTEKAVPRVWFEAFCRLEHVLEAGGSRRSPSGRLVALLDEAPWLAASSSEFILAFAEFWNRYGMAKRDLAVVACGSNVSWMVKRLVWDTGNFYMRVTLLACPKPETEHLLVSRGFAWSLDEIVTCQMVVGGLFGPARPA